MITLVINNIFLLSIVNDYDRHTICEKMYKIIKFYTLKCGVNTPYMTVKEVN